MNRNRVVRSPGKEQRHHQTNNAPKNRNGRHPATNQAPFLWDQGGAMNGLEVGLSSERVSRREETPNVPVSSILTVTVLEAKLKVDTSGFLQKMQVYCQVNLQTLGQELDPKHVPEPQKRSKSLSTAAKSQVEKAVPVILDSLVKKT